MTWVSTLWGYIKKYGKHGAMSAVSKQASKVSKQVK